MTRRMKKLMLKDVLPREFMQGEYDDTPAYKFKDEFVVNWISHIEEAWIGKHKYVFIWFKLENGWAVGWNENPSRGWSFPVKKIR